MSAKMTSGQMLELLEAHYAPPPSKPAGGRLIREIQAPIGLRRADALYLPTTTHGRGTIIGHEVKVSRSDVIAEIRDPHKADAWLRYCNRWWLVIADPSLIDGLDIPDHWGVMAPPTRGRFMTVVRKAPQLSPDPAHLSEAWGTIFAKVAFTDVASQSELSYLRKLVDQMTDAARDARREISQLRDALGEDDGAYRRNRVTVASVLSEVERLGDFVNGEPAFQHAAWKVDPERVARAILAEISGDSAALRDDLARAVQRADEVVARMRGALEALGGEE